ncbi:hypothetical protein [Bacillus toyonensis]|uniref:hypothetical protein n=1 Tax=Bacillus toyonensis TaxID=155322 RepID=UPI002175DB28|nr:hypothetical protein [Bacillus toyonensis]
MFEKLVGVEPRVEYCGCTTTAWGCKSDWTCFGRGRMYKRFLDCRTGDLCGEEKTSACQEWMYCI